MTVVATAAKKRHNKHHCIDGVVLSPKMQYGALTTVSKSLMSDDKLFNYFGKHLQVKEREMECGNKNCIYFDIFLSSSVGKAVAKYLVWFERTNKYELDSMVMDW